jgi:hypothetical protein
VIFFAVCAVIRARFEALRQHQSRVLTGLIASAVMAAGAAAQSVTDIVPASATHCAITTPPATAGLFATPGGFVMVHPRNDALTDSYTGCKALWVVDGDAMRRLATLYFENGTLARAIAHDSRDPKGAIDGACDLKTGRSLLPAAGRRYTDAACKGFQGEELYGLRVPTWPRRCLTEPDAAVCKQDPR